MLYLCQNTKYLAHTILICIGLCFSFCSGHIEALPQAFAKFVIASEDATNHSDMDRALMTYIDNSLDSSTELIDYIFEQQKLELGYWISELNPENLLNYLSFDMLVSVGMSDAVLTKIFEEAHYFQANIIVNGLLPNQTLTQTMAFWRQYAIKHTPPVNVFIDPTVFEAIQARSVPMLIAKVDDKRIATVTGVYSLDWFRRQIATKLKQFESIPMEKFGKQPWPNNEIYHFGNHGPSMTILESNLIQQMQQKLAQIDWEDKKKSAYENFWSNLPSKPLPSAVTCHTYYLDPIIKLREPLLNEHGEILVPKATTINPLSYLPFTQQLIVFNPTSSSEKESIRKYLNYLESANMLSKQRITLIATHFLPQTAWQMLEAIEQAFRMPVFHLTETIQARFNIMTTPTLVIQEGEKFKIQSGCL